MVDFLDKNHKVYSDSVFTAGESPRILDVVTDLGRNAGGGEIANLGGGDLLVEIETDEGNFGDQFPVVAREIFNLDKLLVIRRIRLTHVSDTSYRITVS